MKDRAKGICFAVWCINQHINLDKLNKEQYGKALKAFEIVLELLKEQQ